ncbi:MULTISPECIES: Yip1 family protein [unclassified Streptomyces]|uniref:YIP1 family protein n=1 Tax=Streptomyces sp. NBC_00180 TaxID=2903632 RepID=A0AAU1I1C6_9ACTN|nr:YIP1 family protein [Streptomyces sp. NBC_01017]
MSLRPWVVVESPDSRGLRRVTVGGETVGSAWSLGELRKILGRLGFPADVDLEDRSLICWRGGDSGTWPDRAWRRRAILVLMTVGLLAAMGLNAVVGWPDAAGALTFAQRVTGVLFVLSGLVQGAAALMALDHWGRRQFKVSGAVVLLGVLISLATDSLLLFMWLEETEYTPYLLVFLPLWCWSLWALVLLVREKSWAGVPQPKRFAAGVVATALLTAVSLAYSTMYQPSAAPMHFTLRAEFGTARADRVLPFVHVPLSLRMKNTGGIPVYILNDSYTVRGRGAKYSNFPSDEELLSEWRESVGKPGYPAGEADLHVSDLKKTTLSSGHLYGPGKWLEVGQEYYLERVFEVPKGARYDTVSVDVQVSYMRKDRGKLDVDEFSTAHPSWDEDEEHYCAWQVCGQHLVYQGRLRHNNNLINVTRKPRFVAAIWSPGLSPSSFISSRKFKGGSYKEVRRELDRYGAGRVRADAEVSVAELMRSSGL